MLIPCLCPQLHVLFRYNQLLILLKALSFILLWVPWGRGSLYLMLIALLLYIVNQHVPVDCLRLLGRVVIIHIYHMIVTWGSIVIIKMMDLERGIFFELLSVIRSNLWHFVSKAIFTLSYKKFPFSWSINSVGIPLLCVKFRAIDRNMP
jgi:hypothetical protein